MFEARIHGRGGQGVVTAAELLSLAGFEQGLQSQAFPSFGSERMGAPVVAFCRFDERPIRLREPIVEPTAVVVQDATLLHHVDVFGGLLPEGFVLINSTRSPEELGLGELRERLAAAGPGAERRLLSVPAGELARARLGRPIPSAALLGALIAQTGLLSPAALAAAIEHRFSGRVAAGNLAAAEDAREHVLARIADEREPAGA